MRIKINLAEGKTKIPNNNQHMVNSYIHKCLGDKNEYHDAPSDYSVSTLQGGILDILDKSVVIKNDAYIIVSSFDNNFITKLITGIMKNKIFFGDINVYNFELMPDEIMYNGYNHFRTLSPFLIKYNNKDVKIDDFANLYDMCKFIRPIILNKLIKINDVKQLGINFDKFDIKIEWCHTTKRFIKPNCRGFYVNNCGFTIHGAKDVSELLYNVGLGQSTGAGFGCIYKVENKFLYRNEKIELSAYKTNKKVDFLYTKNNTKY